MNNLHKVLVTGGLGFIGSHIVDYFVKNGDDVTIFDNLSSNVLPDKYFDSVASVRIGDISDSSTLDAVFSHNYDYIFHFAANASVPKSIENEDLNFKSNVVGTYNIIRKAAKNKSSIILASTSAIYGEYNGKSVSEEDSTMPISPYGLSKLIDENLCFHYCRMYGMKFVAFRFFNVYGPRQRHYVMSDFMEKISQANNSTKNIAMHGTGEEIRDFIYIKDIIRALILPLKYDDMWGEAFNVGFGKGIKIKTVLDTILEELGHTAYNFSFSGKRRQGDISGLYANINKIRHFEFEPLFDLRNGIKEFIEAEKKGGLLAKKSIKT